MWDNPNAANVNPMAASRGHPTVITVAYVAAIGVALGVAWTVWDTMPPWAAVLVADLAATVFVFGLSRAFDNTSMYDAYWSVAPPVIAGGLLLAHDGLAPRGLVVFGLVLAWAIRLTFNWWRGWGGLSHEDWRYVDLRKTTGRAYWLASFTGLHLFPTLLVYLACLGLFPIADPASAPLGILDAVAIAWTLGAIATEMIADKQLHDFVASNPAPSDVLTTGLWGRCRHPNYLGECAFWWGIAILGWNADPGTWWVFCGAACITAMFVFISIPMIDKRMLRKRPHYAGIITRYPALLPLGPRTR